MGGEQQREAAGNQKPDGDRDSFNRHLLCVYCVVGAGDTAVDEKDRSLPSQREHPSREDQQ